MPSRELRMTFAGRALQHTFLAPKRTDPSRGRRNVALARTDTFLRQKSAGLDFFDRENSIDLSKVTRQNFNYKVQ